MAGFATRQAVVDALAADTFVLDFIKTGNYSVTGGSHLISLWAITPNAGANPAGTPGAAYESDSSSPVAGSLYLPDKASDVKHLTAMTMAGIGGSGSPGSPGSTSTCVLYDRLVGVGGISLASTGAKTVNSAALTRYTGTDAKDLEVWLEVSTATATTAPVVNISSYTSSDGSNGLAGGSVTFPAALTQVNNVMILPLNEGERGVRSVEEINVGTAASAGVCNILIVKRLAMLPLIPNGFHNEIDLLDDFLTLPRIYDNACLGIALSAHGPNNVSVSGSLTVAYG